MTPLEIGEHGTDVAGRLWGLDLEARERRRALRSQLHRVRIESEGDATQLLTRLFKGGPDFEKGVRVADLADAIADRFPMPAEERQALHWAGRAHRVCRLVIPEAILEKESALSSVEIEIVQRAPSEAFEALLDHPFLSEAGYVLRSLRERPDGRGHPDGLAGAAIPLASRILAVAEAIEAISHDQPHRSARSPADTMLEVLRCAGTQFDADVVHAAALVIAGTGQTGRQATTPLLIVEDEDLIAKTIGRWVNSSGYPVTHATTADEALDAMKTEPAAVVICDVGLPGDHDGLWLVDELRRTYPTTAVVISTGRNYLPASATMRDGVVSYLLKPFECHQLTEAVAEAVRWHENAVASPDAGAALERSAELRRLAVRRRMEGFRVDSAASAERALRALCDNPLERARCGRVMVTAEAIAGGFPMSERDRTALHWAGRFQFLCRLTIPEAILLKPEALTDRELAIVQRGPADASEMMRTHPFLKAAALLIRSIRERDDGRGYPDALAGAAIPPGSRMLGIAEAIEAITHDQPHRPARSRAAAAAELSRRAGTQFDADVVRRAVELMSIH